MFSTVPPVEGLSPHGVYKTWYQTGLLGKMSWICDYESHFQKKKARSKQQKPSRNNRPLAVGAQLIMPNNETPNNKYASPYSGYNYKKNVKKRWQWKQCEWVAHFDEPTENYHPNMLLPSASWSFVPATFLVPSYCSRVPRNVSYSFFYAEGTEIIEAVLLIKL